MYDEHDTRPSRTSPSSSGGRAVRVRPTGDDDVPASNRYQYGVAGSSPVTTTETQPSSSARASTVPDATTDRTSGSVATAHRTGCPGGTRVQSTNPSAAGSALATPEANTGA